MPRADRLTRFGIGPRIALLAVLLVASTALVVGLVVYRGVNQLLVQKEVEELEDQTHLAGVRLRAHARTLRRDALLMAALPSIPNLASEDPGTAGSARAHVEELFAQLIRSRPEYLEVRLLDATGREQVRVARSDDSEVMTVPREADPQTLEDQSSRPYFYQALTYGPREVYLSAVELSRNYGRPAEPRAPVIRASAPVHIDGRPVYVVVINFAFEDMAQSLRELLRLGPQATFYITNERGDFLSHPNPALTFGFEFGEVHRIQASYPGLAPLFAPGSRQHGAFIRSEVGGREQILHFSKVFFDPGDPQRFIGVALAALPEEILVQSIAVGERTVLLTLFLVVVGGFLAVVFAGLLTRPISQLTRAAETVANGGYDVRLPISASHEVGVLAQAFREMIDRVQERGAALEAKAEELERVNRELEQFVYVVSHDLKAPLRAVSNLSTWLQEDLGDDLGEEARRHLELLRARVTRMDQFIEALLAYSRAGRLAAEAEWVDSGELVQELVAMLDPAPGFTVHIPPDMPRFKADRIHLAQVFSNLIGNALKHHNRSSGNIWVEWHSPPGPLFEFAIRDDGPGIEPQYQERIFEVFQTLRSRDESGNTGIGLSIVKKVVETHGGRVSVESAPGQGATFRFTWPKRPILSA